MLLHELLHAYDWDRLVPAESRHATNTHTHHAEAVVEACACLLHCIALRDEGYGSMLDLLKKERQWMWNQAYWYIQNKATSKETHAYEYIVLKTALLFSDESLDIFLKWLSLPTKFECQQQWPTSLKSCLDLLMRSMATTKALQKPTEMSLALVVAQRSVE